MLQRCSNRSGLSLTESPLTPERLAGLLKFLSEGRIHGTIAKQVLEAIFEEDKDPSLIIREKGLEQICDRSQLSAYVDRVLKANPQAVDTIQAGDVKPLGFLVGQIMKETSGRAEPKLVQEILKEKLFLSLIHVLFFGGAISSERQEDGRIRPAKPFEVKSLFETGDLPGKIRFEQVEVSRMLSEEVTPEDWAHLIGLVSEHLASSDTSGIVIAHGTDTLSYTSSLLYWLFADTRVPVILTAADVPPGTSGDALGNLKSAVKKAAEGEPGILCDFRR